MKSQLPLKQRLQNSLTFFNTKPYYEGVEYERLRDGSFELFYNSENEKVEYKSNAYYLYKNSILGSLVDLSVFGGIYSTDINLELIRSEDKRVCQINEFYFNIEKGIFIGKSKKTNILSFPLVLIEQDNKLPYPRTNHEKFNKFNQETLKCWKEWCSSEYKKLRVDFYKSNVRKLEHL